ncbi:hypothetical protein FA95DRAFT_1608812 [Auriscalpium vulgare]|uniref:Uncharacterized protein n=1 Tax=Auriscalpium vulgare TaxID=40419 RepID=A0ACB8RIZ6_9AGAM|nr:hypothetical protein FA95DRAFT_1608812 [Auriscalpium vulgare]
MTDHALPVQVLRTLEDIRLNKFFFIAAYTILLYDHLCTLPTEIESFWKKKKSRFLYLYILIRYYTPFVMTIVAVGFFSPAITYSRCSHWMYFLPIAVTLTLMFLSGSLMAIRVYALWSKNIYLFSVLLLYLSAQTIVGLWSTLKSGGKPFPYLLNNYEFHFCIFLSPVVGAVSSSSIYVFMDLGYDTIVFLLTISRTIYIHRTGRANGVKSGNLVQSLARDGAVYFGRVGIFCINFIWVVMILTARPTLHGLSAMPSSVITTILVTRITTNLRLVAHGPARLHERTVDGVPLTVMHSQFVAAKPSRQTQFTRGPYLEANEGSRRQHTSWNASGWVDDE